MAGRGERAESSEESLPAPPICDDVLHYTHGVYQMYLTKKASPSVIMRSLSGKIAAPGSSYLLRVLRARILLDVCEAGDLAPFAEENETKEEATMRLMISVVKELDDVGLDEYAAEDRHSLTAAHLRAQAVARWLDVLSAPASVDPRAARMHWRGLTGMVSELHQVIMRDLDEDLCVDPDLESFRHKCCADYQRAADAAFAAGVPTAFDALVRIHSRLVEMFYTVHRLCVMRADEPSQQKLERRRAEVAARHRAVARESARAKKATPAEGGGSSARAKDDVRVLLFVCGACVCVCDSGGETLIQCVLSLCLPFLSLSRAPAAARTHATHPPPPPPPPSSP